MNSPAVANLFDLSGRVAIVTGASGNIGSGIAKRLYEAGTSVMVHGSHRGGRAESLAVELGSRARPVFGDVERDAKEICAETQRVFGRIDILVNNAGIQPVAPLLSIDTVSMSEMLRINVGGVAAMTSAATVVMLKNERGKTGAGAIVNIASIEGLQPAFMHSHYAASKAAVIMHTRAAALELGPSGIRVNSVSPGLIRVQGIEQAWPDGVARWHEAAPLSRMGEPEDVADAVLFLVSSAARWITGTNLVVDGGVLTRNTW